MHIGLSTYTLGMDKKTLRKLEREKAYKMDRGFRSAKAGAVVGMVLGALAYMLFSRWLPESFFAPVVLIAAAIFAVVFGLFFPMELSYHELDDDSDSITPADRVNRLHTETKKRN